MLDLIKSNAELLRNLARNHFKVDIGYDLDGVRWLNGFLQRQHEIGDASLRPNLVSICGSFLGECIVQSYGWSWDFEDGNWYVKKDEDNGAYPFAKVDKHLENGAEDEVLSFFTTIPLIFADSTH